MAPMNCSGRSNGSTGAGALVVALIVVLVMTTGEWTAARAAYRSDNSDHASLLERARQGNPQAMYRVALAFHRGKGPARNDVKAFEWFKAAADAGHLRSAFAVGLMYVRGQGVEQDVRQGLEWYARAARRGQPEALRELGVHFQEGLGVERDLTIATDFFNRAVDAGDVPSLVDLGRMYVLGKDVAQDLPRAARLFTHAAELGNLNAHKNLILLYSEGLGVKKDAARVAYWQQRLEALENESDGPDLPPPQWTPRGDWSMSGLPQRYRLTFGADGVVSIATVDRQPILEIAYEDHNRGRIDFARPTPENGLELHGPWRVLWQNENAFTALDRKGQRLELHRLSDSGDAMPQDSSELPK